MDQVTQVKTQLRLEHWKQLISECQASGMSVCSWCKENNVSEPSYYYYLKRLRQQAIVSLPNTKAAVIIRLPQATLEIADGTSQQTIQAVLLALQSVC